ncbi:MAG: hypothetical protein ABI222_05285 [Opitutaceae bacterium]
MNILSLKAKLYLPAIAGFVLLVILPYVRWLSTGVWVKTDLAYVLPFLLLLVAITARQYLEHLEKRIDELSQITRVQLGQTPVDDAPTITPRPVAPSKLRGP